MASYLLGTTACTPPDAKPKNKKLNNNNLKLATTTINQRDVDTRARTITNNTCWHDDDNNNEPRIMSTAFMPSNNLGFDVSLLLYS
jgi:hypothetical protein